MPTRFDKRYCDECMINHWLETTNRHKAKCHGPDYLPRETPTHYTRWRARGIELCKKTKTAHMSIDWTMLEEAKDLSWLELGI